MPERVSLLESYNNKDVVTQIYRLAEIIDKSTYKSLTVSRDGNNINFVFTTNDDVVHTYAVPDAGIVDVQGSAVGSQVTIVFTMTDGTTKSFTYTANGGVTIDTDQTISGMKVFTAASTNFSHDVDVGADLNVGGTVEANELTVDTGATVDGNLNIGGNVAITGNVTTDLNVIGDIANHHMAIEEYNGDTVLAVEQNLILNDGTTVPTSDSSGKVATTKWVTDARNADTKLVRTTGNQTITGNKTLVSKLISNTGKAFSAFDKKTSDVTRGASSDNYIEFIRITDVDGNLLFTLNLLSRQNGVAVYCDLYKANGTSSRAFIARNDQ